MTDDLEMKAISAKYGTPRPPCSIARRLRRGVAVQRDPAAQVAAIEALIHAVEEALPLKRVEDALARHGA